MSIVCPTCGGSAKTFAFLDGPGIHESRWLDCTTCRGTGRIDADRGLLIEQGRELRKARVAAGIGLREAAKARGMSNVDYSRLERGE